MANNINKNLLKAVQGVNKKYKEEGLSNFANEIGEKPIVTHSSGSRLLDLAIGDGERAGFPEGRMIELYGPESSGKCVTSGTYLLTPQGYRTLASVFEDNGTPIEVKEEEVEAEISLINRYGEEETTYAITFNGVKEVLKIRTEHGYMVEVTKNHPLLSGGKWIEAQGLKEGQTLSVLPGTHRYIEDEGNEVSLMTTTKDTFLQHTEEQTVSFLRSMFEANDGVLKGGESELRRIQLALLNAGTISSLQEEEDGWVLTEVTTEVDYDEIFHDPIVSIESGGEQPTFDVAMPETQSFIGNGIINHNTTIALLAIAERQRVEDEKAAEDPNYEKKVCVFMDAEFALDMDLAVEYGVNLDELIIIRPDQAEDGMDILDSYIRSGGVALAVVDSVSALVPSQAEQSSFHQQTMALTARFMSQVCTRMSGPIWKNDSTVLFINQVREKVGAWSPSGTTPETTPGGRALKFHSTLRISVRRGETIGKTDDPDGHVMNVRIVKNKIAPPNKTASIKLYYGIGVDTVEELGEIAIARGVITQGGAWFKAIDKETGEVLEFDGEVANYQGRDSLFSAIDENNALRAYIEEEIRTLGDDTE